MNSLPTFPIFRSVNSLKKTLRSLPRTTGVAILVGKPLKHSLSNVAYERAFQIRKMNAVMIRAEIDPLQFSQFMKDCVLRDTRMDYNFLGLAVTHPFKYQVMQFRDRDDTETNVIGVNTFIDRGSPLAYNTDTYGGIALGKVVHKELKGKECAVIGTGPAAASVAKGLFEAGAEVTIISRDKHRARTVAENVEAQHTGSLATFKRKEFDLAVNATPLGLRHSALQNESPLPADSFQTIQGAADVNYGPSLTPFLQLAQAKNCRITNESGDVRADGLVMLCSQMIRQFEIITKLPAPDEDDIMKALRQALKTIT
jgi:shikimate dehydrogenase